jgi:hypothetical protein
MQLPTVSSIMLPMSLLNASCPVPSAHMSIFNYAVVVLISLFSSFNWSIINCSAASILDQYSYISLF